MRMTRALCGEAGKIAFRSLLTEPRSTEGDSQETKKREDARKKERSSKELGARERSLSLLRGLHEKREEMTGTTEVERG